MKRNLTIAVASIALAVPAIAVGQGGAHAVYEGHLIGARDSSVRLKESFGDLERAVKTFAVRHYTVQCQGDVPAVAVADEARRDDPGRQGRRLQGQRRQRPHRVQGQRPHRPQQGDRPVSLLTGRLKADNGQTLNCDSGKLEWKARP